MNFDFDQDAQVADPKESAILQCDHRSVLPNVESTQKALRKSSSSRSMNWVIKASGQELTSLDEVISARQAQSARSVASRAGALDCMWFASFEWL